MRISCLALPLAALSLALISSTAHAAPSSTKEGASPSSSSPSSASDRSAALRLLEQGEALLNDESTLADGIAKMLEAYVILEQTDGAEARGVKELRSWLVKALDTLGMSEEAAELRSRGPYVDHPLSVMPSTWFPSTPAASAGGSGSAAAGGGGPGGAAMTYDEAAAAFEQGLTALKAGNIEGLGQVIDAYEAVEILNGAESDDAIVVRSFLVAFLEAGGFNEEAAVFRSRGSVEEASSDDTLLYQSIWLDILEQQQSTPLGSKSLKGDINSSSPSPSPQPTPSPQPEVEPEPVDPDRPNRPGVEAGSATPAALIDLGLGSFQPDLGRKGYMWNLGFEVEWTLFRVGLFGMQLGGGGRFGRNRDKRWETDAYAALGLDFDLRKVFITPEFGGGYDGIAGGDTPLTEAMRVGHAPYYHFGGTLGFRLGDQLALYGRAVRLNRDLPEIRNELRIRGGIQWWFEDEGAVDFAFVFTGYEGPDEGPSAQLYTGNIGFRF
ncbi:hypothetical protein PPSIR1_03813 [Plesiocystis pacifica SIR-1]|uniref:Uncharacterized protein n=1 Tax=Plesiocystis pacifica SIR-1 TaxID=391625 RepID=A6G4C1_9BACT|nr:hypothetical protein [Plesiocystis pacifica]EDM79233.1 hypothetical protein PPSIR1_03813 [Plesiocystis pacifica SIR-1]